mgnify:CR=1 FL=1
METAGKGLTWPVRLDVDKVAHPVARAAHPQSQVVVQARVPRPRAKDGRLALRARNPRSVCFRLDSSHQQTHLAPEPRVTPALDDALLPPAVPQLRLEGTPEPSFALRPQIEVRRAPPACTRAPSAADRRAPSTEGQRTKVAVAAEYKRLERFSRVESNQRQDGRVEWHGLGAEDCEFLGRSAGARACW